MFAFLAAAFLFVSLSRRCPIMRIATLYLCVMIAGASRPSDAYGWFEEIPEVDEHMSDEEVSHRMRQLNEYKKQQDHFRVNELAMENVRLAAIQNTKQTESETAAEKVRRYRAAAQVRRDKRKAIEEQEKRESIPTNSVDIFSAESSSKRPRETSNVSYRVDPVH